jgi:quercetin dioxygenase-like cupin family protein
VSTTPRRIRTAFLVAGALAPVAAGGVYAAGVSAHGSAAAVRNSLAQAEDVVGAKGKELTLSRVTIPAGAQLPLHHHAGTQIAHIERGTLTYTVKTGEVRVMKGEADVKPKLVHRISAGQTGKIHAGEWIVEQPTVTHTAGNNGKTKVVIYLASLVPAGSPPSIPVQ